MNINSYPFQTNIIVDTNNENITNFLKRYKNVHVFVHKTLYHPHHLTCIHRQHFMNNMDNYDIFYYTEDDIIVPPENFNDYLEKIEYMFPKYVPCYVRLEWSNIKKTFMALDIHQKENIYTSDIINLKNKKYFSPKLPYHGFWILSTKFLKNLDLSVFKVFSSYREHLAAFLLGPPEKDFAHDKN
jgi:hypothetical protein